MSAESRARNRRELEEMDAGLENVENALHDAVYRAGALAGQIRAERQKLARLLNRNPLPEQPSEPQSELDLDGGATG